MPILPPEPDRYPEDLFSLPRVPEAASWWVARVRPRREKCLARLLHGEGIGYYLPLRRRRAGAANASRVASLPLFPGYLFLFGEDRHRRRALQAGSIVSYVPVEDQARLHRELESLSRLQRTVQELEPWYGFSAGTSVRIVEGPLAGLEGEVIRKKGRCRLVLQVTTLGASVAAEVEAGWVVAADGGQGATASVSP